MKLKKLKVDGAETGLQIEAVVPEKTSAMIHVPNRSSEHFAIHVNDKLIWQDGKLTGTSDKITYHSESEKYVVFEFQAGSYVIHAADNLKQQERDVPEVALNIDDQTLKEWSAPYRGWHYHPDHVILPEPHIEGFEDIMMTDVPTVFQLSGDEKWYMSFIAYDGKGYQSFIAESEDLVHWDHMGLAMGYGPEGEFDYGGVVLGAYLYADYGIKSPRILKKRGELAKPEQGEDRFPRC